jgi:hypothetical protein
VLLGEEGVTFQRRETWKTSRDPDCAAKKARIGHLYAIAGGEVIPEDGEPEVIFCVDAFGLLNRQPRPGRQWAAVSGKGKEPGRAPRPRMRAAYTRTAGVRHLFAACELGEDKLFGHIKPRKTRGRFLEFCRYLRSLCPPQVRIAIVCGNFSPHLTTASDGRAGAWATAGNVEIAYTPADSSWLNRVEAQFTALRYFALDGTGHPSRKQQASMIRRYIIWRNSHACDERLRQVVTRADVAGRDTAPPPAGTRLPGPVLHAGAAVDAFPQQVGVAVVAGVLLDHVDVDPAEADVLLAEAAGVGQSTARAVPAGAADLRAPGGKGVAQGGALSQFEAAVGAIRISLRVVDGRGLFCGEHSAEPVPLNLRHVLDEAGQCEGRGRHGRGGGLLIVQALALHGEGGAVEVKPAFERAALVRVQRRHRTFDGAHRSIIASGRSRRQARLHNRPNVA